MGPLAYVEGEFCLPGEKKIYIEDRGYQFGDGVYEVVRVYGGRTFGLNAHLDRLWASAGAVEIEIPQTRAEIEGVVRELVEKSGFGQAQVYIQITRGVAPRQHGFPSGARPVLVMTVREAPEIPQQLREGGGAVITHPEIRWKYCHIKTLNLLPNIMAKEAAARAGVQEALFVREDGVVTEGSSTNVFIVKNNTLYTHPANQSILRGVTRAVTLDICFGKGLKVVEKPFILGELLGADEVFLTGTISEIMPIVTVDGRRIGSGVPGPVTKEIYESFLQHVQLTDD
ncbi:MAG: D-amino-acid transaminase [Bacillota bacterium]